jgi:hypothetical protein
MALAIDAVDEHHRGRAVGNLHSALAIAPAIGVTALEPLVVRVGIDGVLLLTAGLAAVMSVGMAMRNIDRKSASPRAAG